MASNNPIYQDHIFSAGELPTTIENTTFIHCEFCSLDLSEIQTIRCHFEQCNFRGAGLGSSVHKYSSFLNCDFDESNLFLAQFQETKMTGSSFLGANLAGMTIKGGDWSYTNFRNQKLSKMDLRGSIWREADLYSVDLSGSKLQKADLRRAILQHASLEKSNILGALTEGWDWSSIKLKETKMDLNQAIQFAEAFGAKVEV
ncbi:pentapeptide repeat-containing protein [Risungbinella massiliensis]|uniref:pentapeptide repeat-containing protein n=1 Tax=Risungbinella massiliensis TaxID=1329796 RepID=UPI000699943F|nr:pentapeptide repeat-containing protein [Risungbinella massiliensis]